MATSGTFTFRLTVEEMIREAYERCQIDPQLLTRNDYETAMRSLNLLFVDWSVRGINYWTTDRQSQVVTAGTAQYTLSLGTLDILNAMLSRGGTETIVTRKSLEDYDSLPDKTTSGMPVNFFIDRQYLPTVTLWPVPDNSTDIFYYWRMAQVEDITALAQDANSPYRWTEAVCSGLAVKLYRKKGKPFDPILMGDLKLEAADAFAAASEDERDRATLKIIVAAVV